MKKVLLAIILATAYLIVFHLSPNLGIPSGMIYILFMLSPIVVISMVYVVLKYGEPSKYTFKERFYDDWGYKRNVTAEEDEK